MRRAWRTADVPGQVSDDQFGDCERLGLGVMEPAAVGDPLGDLGVVGGLGLGRRLPLAARPGTEIVVLPVQGDLDGLCWRREGI
jgi:hypothetical protein